MRTSAWMIALVGGLTTACGAGALPQRPPPDQPVPASEPRAVLSAQLDLQPARDCEESFDLALYEDRAIDLISWDERTSTCNDRKVDIRYLSKKISRDRVIERARNNAVRVEVIPSEGSNDAATK